MFSMESVDTGASGDGGESDCSLIFFSTLSTGGRVSARWFSTDLI
jgi:hypothetical protein